MKRTLSLVVNRDRIVSNVREVSAGVVDSNTRIDRAMNALAHLRAAAHEIRMMGGEPTTAMVSAIRDLELMLET